MKDIEDNGYKYLGILQRDTIKGNTMREQFIKDQVSCEVKFEWKVQDSDEHPGSGDFEINWFDEDLQQLDRKTRKNNDHPKSVGDRLYVPKKKEEEDLSAV